MDKTLMQKYADFVVKVGVNVQPRQTFLIRCPVDMAFFAHACAKAGYEAGAKEVIVRYEDEQLARLKYEMADEETLKNVHDYELRSWLDYAEDPEGCCLLAIHASDPEIFAGLDGEKLNRVSLARRKAMKPWNEYTMKDRVQWCVAALPTPAWAKKVFPGLEEAEAVEKLWQVIFDVCRVTGGDPVSAWQEHVEKTTARRDKLNEMGLVSLRFTSGNGTDLTVGLAEESVWEGAASTAENGARFIANVPTEEVFTAPHCRRVNGVVKGTKPYVYNGQTIKGFSVTFEEGKAVAWSAQENEELLGQLLTSDEGACRLGEVALVPASSPINRSGLLFYNTLFDENAACHIAFGDSYPGTTRGGTGLSREELDARGMNHSAIHEDVMIGAEDTRVVGTTADGREILIFEGGEWAF
ncbi:MAG: aminopeptidase [Oscillospiraceae bacterium]|nr:aminopeptidase [Oscillospiraceae bacterium]